MSYQALTTIVQFLSIIHSEQHDELINKLNRFYNFDHNVFVLDTSFDLSYRFINTNIVKQKDFTPQTLFVIDSLKGNATGLEQLTEIQSKHALVVLVPQYNDTGSLDSTENLIDRIVQLHQSSMQRFHVSIKIGIFLHRNVGDNELLELFQWCWDRGVINIFAATNRKQDASKIDSLNIFSFNPFGTFRVTMVRADESFTNIFLNQNCNFQQYPIRFRAPYMRLSDKMLWFAVFKLINSSFEDVDHVDSTNEENISPMLYYMGNRRISRRGYMYPMKMESEVIVVPQALPYSEFFAYLQSVASDEIFVYSTASVIALTAVLIISRFIKRKILLLLQSVVDVANLLMNDNGAIRYQQLNRSEAFIVVPLTFVGFVVVNGILSSLQSYLTRPILQPQIDDIDGLYQSSLKLFTLDETWKSVLTEELQNQSMYKDWADKIHVIDVLQLDEEISSFNTSISFLWNLPTIQCLLRIQKRLSIRGYHILNVNIYGQHLTYVVNDSFPFTERFNELASQMKSAGLYNKWVQMEDDEYENEILKIMQKKYSDGERPAEPFTVPMFIVYGWIGGVVVLVVEIIWKNFSIPLKTLVRKVFLERRRLTVHDIGLH